MSTIIRKATPEDVPSIYQLIVELAEYEKALHEVINTPEQLLKDGFGENPLFGAIIAEVKGEVVGMSLYYYRYSTWKGKRLYLEDLIIKEAFRGYGLGKRLLEATVEEARQTECSGLMWQVLDWNEPSIEFYKKFGAKLDEEWINCHFDL
ncbi:GNAT family N-acetyltransferase [Siphonobacter sp. SORGH_AS_0500]|uniref:GNAT family N-acetyltransferase n=1 Tax=Siphonobacter sp. SORGH_AS_0500 TaxID=1864824 RepID=UPI002865FCB2|nr:GNAT family N-acetyltransferase [Siphonobacter sp. SORGH_AS_0500]MDR6194631.1 GNAT superfamily N-acetyltransferase [Siphonobacter sp. SORGH_AS_0500]